MSDQQRKSDQNPAQQKDMNRGQTAKPGREGGAQTEQTGMKEKAQQATRKPSGQQDASMPNGSDDDTNDERNQTGQKRESGTRSPGALGQKPSQQGGSR